MHHPRKRETDGDCGAPKRNSAAPQPRSRVLTWRGALLLRVLLYGVLLPLAVLAIVPNGFDVLAMIAQGRIGFEELWPFERTPRAPAITEPAPPPAFHVVALGDGKFKLADSHWSGHLDAPEIAGKLAQEAARWCAMSDGVPKVTQSSQFNSHGYNDADLEFWCEGRVDAGDQAQLDELESQLVRLRERIGFAIERLDVSQREAQRTSLGELGLGFDAARRASRQARIAATRALLTQHEALLNAVIAMEGAAADSTAPD